MPEGNARELLGIDPETATPQIVDALRTQVPEALKRRGLVLGTSGGIDSSVCASLAVHALGPRKVLGVFLPERDSDPRSLEMARELADLLGMDWIAEDVSAPLEPVGCYERRDEAVRQVVPDFGEGWGCELVLGDRHLQPGGLTTCRPVVRSPGGEEESHRLRSGAYRQTMAATNFKQRGRMIMEYYHADRVRYAVLGTPNRLEFD